MTSQRSAAISSPGTPASSTPLRPTTQLGFVREYDLRAGIEDSPPDRWPRAGAATA